MRAFDEILRYRQERLEAFYTAPFRKPGRPDLSDRVRAVAAEEAIAQRHRPTLPDFSLAAVPAT